jgi:hypothetical protein
VTDHHRNGGREQIHLTGPSLLPLATAVGIAVALMGLILATPGKLASWAFVAVGCLILIVAGIRWIRTVRDEIDSLPSERR